MSETLRKIFRLREWQAFKETGSFSGSPQDLRDGYIHLSTAEQLPRTLAKHFANEACVIVAELDLKSERDALRWEPASDGALFPHLYAPLHAVAVVRATRYLRAAEGLQAAEAVAP